MDVWDENGNSILGSEILIGSRESRKFYFKFNFPTDKQNGSYHGALKFKYLDQSINSSTIEVYYSHQNKVTGLYLNKMRLNNSKDSIEYSINNKGNHYTFFRFEVTLQDPQTGFTRSYYTTSRNEKRPFYAHIRNFLLPKDLGETTIESNFKIEGFKKLFQLEYKKSYPDKESPTLLVMVVLPAFGIDHQTWKNHFYKYLPRRSFTIIN